MYALEKLLPSHQQSTSNGELAFFDTLLKFNNGKISVLVYKNLRVLTNIYTTALITIQIARKVLFPPCLIEHIPISTIKMT